MKNLQIGLLALLIVACATPKTDNSSENQDFLNAADFDTIIGSDTIALYSLENENGVQVYLTNYGARIVAVLAPDKNGELADITIGYGTIKEYLNDPLYSGPIVGRYANRIKDAKFVLDGKEYELFKNDGDNTLHGGKEGFDKRIWKATQNGNSVTMSYLSPDGEEGYPGNLSVSKTYTLTPDNELRIDYKATTDAPTIVNLSNHTLWNLKGQGDSTILDHYFVINADYFTPVDNEWIPTGEIAPVAGTPMDFTEGKQIGQDIDADYIQLKNGLGYDHNWVLNKEKADSLSLAAKLWEEETGRMIEVYTNKPGFQFYSGNFLNGSVTGRSGIPYLYRSGLIFETQDFPDAPNHENFPSTVLRPGEEYQHTAILKFTTLEAE